MDGFFQKYFSKLTIVAREPKLFTNENEVVTADLHKGKKIHLRNLGLDRFKSSSSATTLNNHR